ncbi:YjgP/YjgQ family permease [Treponema phagedenis]|uniref:Permease, YjgP/YjgQ family n=1 Tax=Treponema phagedenis TaxID=162 RepID=A0A0B7GWF7_TREPH|nr:LptF/LptG family permease [Treponema phagedenis]NVP25278.1 YjgP/YjgQ family permease [Treponema phagedenis]QEJ93987.1 YjgP/YjgQ family permease [Treponema phagedenis]QEJ97045.1 YjgP/YjgQ family permease [Treponema phagedenis]QEK02005.1 YjgP/YjgQ family permease [Treponema phagedenis]QEK02955.1 YjgP/YjgQ family permease [Treponema phagedenis]
MKILQRYLLQIFFPTALVAILFFILLLEIGDLFANLPTYLTNGVGLAPILQVMYFYFPKCISFAMPLGVLFAGAYTMGTLYARNELTSVFASGMPIWTLVLPLVILGFIFSVGMFFFEDRVVIHTQYKKNRLTAKLLETEKDLSTNDIVVLSENNKIIYSAEVYDAETKNLLNLQIIVRTDDGEIEKVVTTAVAIWEGDAWELTKPAVYIFSKNGQIQFTDKLAAKEFTEAPENFQRNITSIDELSVSEAATYIQKLKRTGRPYTEELAQYYRRFSFPFTIFLVLFFSVSVGGRFRKNILLMSLLFSLLIATVYYVTEMVTMLLAKWEYISPLAGALLPFLIFTSLSIFLLRHAKT